MKTLTVLAISLLPWLAALDAERRESSAPPPFGDTNQLAPPLDARPWSTDDAAPIKLQSLAPLDPLKGATNSDRPVPPIPTFADGVLIADAILAENKGFHGLLSPQEKVALCLRVWQSQRGGAK